MIRIIIFEIFIMIAAVFFVLCIVMSIMGLIWMIVFIAREIIGYFID